MAGISSPPKPSLLSIERHVYHIVVTDLYDGTEKKFRPFLGRTYALQFASEVGVSSNTVTNVFDDNHQLVRHQGSY